MPLPLRNLPYVVNTKFRDKLSTSVTNVPRRFYVSAQILTFVRFELRLTRIYTTCTQQSFSRSTTLTQRIHIVSNVNLPSTCVDVTFGATPPLFFAYIHSPIFINYYTLLHHVHYKYTPHVHNMYFFTSIHELFNSFLYTSFIIL